jgi:hypothetical protein
MIQEQRNRRRERLALFYFWQLVASCIVVLTLAPLLMDGWTNWNVLYSAAEILLFACAYPKLLLIQRPASLWLFRRLVDNA